MGGTGKLIVGAGTLRALEAYSAAEAATERRMTARSVWVRAQADRGSEAFAAENLARAREETELFAKARAAHGRLEEALRSDAKRLAESG